VTTRSAEDRDLLERSLFLFSPVEAFRAHIHSVHDIWSYRRELKQCRYEPIVLRDCAQLVRAALDTGRRFRVFDALKVLRSQVSAADGIDIPVDVIRDLFAIYRHLILKSREEVQWTLSRLIKDQQLAGEDLDWMIENWESSHHLVNRLLLYPQPSQKVLAWAAARYDEGTLPARMSELVALLFPERGLEAFAGIDPPTIAWGIWRARINPESKIAALERLVPHLSADTIVKIAARLNAPTLVHAALQER
jgi:hypothetical protein